MKGRVREYHYCGECKETTDHIRQAFEDWKCTRCGKTKRRTVKKAEPET